MKSRKASNNQSHVLKVLNLFGDGGRYAGDVRRSKTHEMHFFQYSYDDYMSVDATGVSYWSNSEKLRETVAEIFLGGYHLCACDSNDAILLQFIASRQGFNHAPFLINEVDKFEMARGVSKFILNYYKEDFFRSFVTSPYNCWMYIIKTRQDYYNEIGISKKNLFYMPMSKAAIEFTFPDYFKNFCVAETPTQVSFKNKILAIGTHNRDYETLVNAAKKAGLEVHIITNLKLNPPIKAPGVFWYDSLPEADFNRAIIDAKCVIIPLRVDNRASGQMGCAIAMKMGKSVITTQCESVTDHIIHGETGYLYESGSEEGLLEVLKYIHESPGELQRVGKNAQKKERELSKVASRSIARFLDWITRI